MDALLQQMGQEIIADERQIRRQQSRLWTIDDMIDALTHNKGTTDVEAISIPYYFEQIDISPNAFSSMFKLRFLRIDCPVLHCPMGLEFLPDSIRYLSWVYYPLQYLPSSYNAEKLVELHLDFSNLEHIIWNKPLKNLKRIYLPSCESLFSISDLAMAPNLEVLHLRSCSSLTEIGSSIENLSKLTQLDLKWCKSLSYLSDIPCSINELELSECGLRQLPSAIGRLTHLQELLLGSCERLESLPNSICNLKSLRRLNLSNCKNLNKLPENFGNLESLEELDASYSGLKELPLSMQILKCLAILDVRGCTALSHLSEFPFSLKELVLKGSGIRQLPFTIGYLTHLKGLSMESCEKLVGVPYTICYLTSLEIIDLRGCSSLIELVPSIENLKKLTQLDLRGCRSLSCLPNFPSSVKELHLLGSGIKQLPPRIGCLIHLKVLSLDSCERLESLPSSICDLKSLERLSLLYCRNLNKLPENLGSLESLLELDASFSGLRELPLSIKKLKRLILLDLTGCENIKSLPALPLRLQVLLAENCASIEVLLHCPKLFRIGSSIMDQPRWEAHYGSTKMPYVCVDGTGPPEWMKYCNKSGSSLYLDLDTCGYSINIICCVIILSYVTPRYSLPMVVLVDQIQETCCQFCFAAPNYELIQRTSKMVFWNFYVRNCCKNINEISFKLMGDFTGKDVDSEQSKIIKCGVHLVFEKKNCRKRNHQDEDEHF